MTQNCDSLPDRCTCGDGSAEEDRGAVLRCPVHGIGPTPCPYCEGEGCSECDGTGERYATYICAGDGLSAVVHGSAPLTDEAADAITAVIRAAYDQMARPSDEEEASQ
jgi:phage/plasmid primase-like uncharacterized protein